MHHVGHLYGPVVLYQDKVIRRTARRERPDSDRSVQSLIVYESNTTAPAVQGAFTVGVSLTSGPPPIHCSRKVERWRASI